jgi:L-alanine-DL-glutamate epimerase-like enolase superfamily enzyme
MHIRAERISLQLKNPFKLSYGASTIRENVLVHISDGLRTGVGEAAVVPYYGETPERVLEYLNSPALKQAIGNNPLRLEDALDNLPPAPSATAIAAVDMALHDLWAKTLGHPLYRLWGLNPARCLASSFTVAMAENEHTYREHLRAAAGYSIVKLKLGSGNIETDLRFVQIARDELHAKLCVDANGGWSAQEALAIMPYLADMGILFVEQPVAKEDFEGWQVLRETLSENSPPLIADESVQGLESVMQLAGLVEGINVKLAKCGGLRPARQMITLARAFGMQVMIGCMIESSVAVTAAAHLAPLADYADLDANLLITNDPYRGVTMTTNGQLILPDTPGIGVTRLI